jgi:hypothetical protein
MTDPLQPLWHLIREFPIQALAGAIVPLGQFGWQKLRMRQDKQRKLHLRERLVALNTFILSLDHVAPDAPHRAESLEDALAERETVLKELAASIAHARTSRRASILKWWSLQRLALLNLPVRPLGWILRWSFFTLVVATVVGAVRMVLHRSSLPQGYRAPFLITTIGLAIVVRVVTTYVDRRKKAEA